MRLFHILAVVTFTTSAHALDLGGDPAPSHGLRLSIQVLPDEADADVSGQVNGTASGEAFDSVDSVDLDRHYRLAVGWHYAHPVTDLVDLQLGAGITRTAADQDTAGDSIDYDGLGLYIEPGIGLRLHESFRLEAALLIGGGILQADYAIDDFRASGSTTDGSYAEVAILVRPVLTWDGFEVFGELGWIAQEYQVTLDGSLGSDAYDLDYELDVAGLLVGFGGGYRF
jgi:hypothetical protein